MRMPPPGASSTLANKVRARSASASSGFSPSAFKSLNKADFGMRTQAASRWLIRPAISAAPALVKVRHRIAPGSTPCSNSRNTRAARTWVLPVPADADSQTCARGSLARA